MRQRLPCVVGHLHSDSFREAEWAWLHRRGTDLGDRPYDALGRGLVSVDLQDRSGGDRRTAQTLRQHHASAMLSSGANRPSLYLSFSRGDSMRTTWGPQFKQLTLTEQISTLGYAQMVLLMSRS